ncbi:MAG: DUF1232 domain-containing protein [Sphingomonadales bacterium]|nr:DUF1232 domain-containing protein [Sphingomonadales bacterium]
MNLLRQWAGALKRDVIVVWLVARDLRVRLSAKLLAGLVAAYALSPIDLVPDFIPVLGLLDDLLLVPAGIWLTLRLIDPALVAELRERARAAGRPKSRFGAALVLLVWLAALAGLAWTFVWQA